MAVVLGIWMVLLLPASWAAAVDLPPGEGQPEVLSEEPTEAADGTVDEGAVLTDAAPEPAAADGIADSEAPVEPATSSTSELAAAPEPSSETGVSAVSDTSETASEPASADDRVGQAHVATATPAVEPIVVLLGGTPITEDAGHKVEGCSVDLAASGLAATESDPVPVGVQIEVLPPTVPEGSSLLVVDDTQLATASTWADSYDMTDLLGGLEAKPNGYRLEVRVLLGGDEVGSKQIWLACGAAQTGHPSRILFEVTWLGADGDPVGGPLDAVLPAGWRDDHLVRATSLRGSAECSYPAGSDVLVCAFDNPGHGSKPGLVVPGGKKHTYDVEQVGLPGGWVVDPATVGTFFGRDTCPKGGCGDDDDHGPGGGHDGGCDGDHETVSAAAESEGGRTCTHVVVNRRLPVELPPVAEPSGPQEMPDLEPAISTPEPSEPVAVMDAGLTRSEELPRTGAETGPATRAGLWLVTVGTGLWALSALARRSTPLTSSANSLLHPVHDERT